MALFSAKELADVLFKLYAKELADVLFKLYDKSKMAVFLCVLFFWMGSASLWKPSKWFELFNMIELINSYQQPLFFTFCGTSFILFFVGAHRISRYFQQTLNTQHMLEAQQKVLQERQTVIDTLSHGEKVILREFFLTDKQYISFKYQNPYVISLVEKGVLTSNGIKTGYAMELYMIKPEFNTRLTAPLVMLPKNSHQDPSAKNLVEKERIRYIHLS